jgi:hypothetical protein
MTTTTRYGVDVSYANPSALIPDGVDFVIARASCGPNLDRRFEQHAKRARELGASLGAYHFFWPRTHALAQADTFSEACERVNFEQKDLFPLSWIPRFWIDVEATDAAGKHAPEPWWVEPLFTLVELIRMRWGDCGLYLNQRTGKQLGSPDLSDVPLWIAHWRQTPGPPASIGGLKPCIHQYRVGPYSRGALHVAGRKQQPTDIDHDRCEAPSPTADSVPPDQTEAPTRPEPAPSTPAPPDFDPDLELSDDDWDEMRRERDALLATDE